MRARSILTIVLMAIVSTATIGQTTRSEKEARGLSKIVELNEKNGIGVSDIEFSKLKTTFDKDLTNTTVQIITEEDWVDVGKTEYLYSEDRRTITMQIYDIYEDGTEEHSVTVVFQVNDMGYVTSVSTTYEGDEDYSYEERFYYNEDGRIDSLTYTEFYLDEVYFDLLSFNYVTEDSIRYYQYYDYNGSTGEYDSDYAVYRDGNYIEYIIYDDWVDRYTYYNTTFIDLLHEVNGEFQLFEFYNDELYNNGTEIIPYAQQYITSENESIVSVAYDEYFDGEWFTYVIYDHIYEGGVITILEDQQDFGDGFEPFLRTLYTYGTSTNVEFEDDFQPFKLSQNYPNPFNPTTNISFELISASEVELKVFNVIGKEVATVLKGTISAGAHTVIFDAEGLPSGIYYYQLRTQNTVETKSMMLIK